jgi:Siphovirus Gp157
MRASVILEVSQYQLVKMRLLSAYPDLDHETLADTLEGITNLHEMIAAVIRSALVDEALHMGLRFRLDDMRQRLSRIEERATKKRQLALDAMVEAGLNKLEQPDFTASSRTGSPALIVIAEDIIPDAYGVPQPPKLDRQTILGELKGGGEIPGAEAGNDYAGKPRPVVVVQDDSFDSTASNCRVCLHHR